jgi:succinate-acetate transporter protein
MGLAMFYGGLVQLLAGMWEVKLGNTFGATAFAAYGGFWMSFAALFVDAFGFMDGYKDAEDTNNCLGIYLFAWCIFSGLMTIAAHRTNLLLFTLLAVVWLTFLLLAISHFVAVDHPNSSMSLQQAGGVTGIIAAALAWYGMMAGLMTAKTSLVALPVYPMDPIWKRLGYLKDNK